MKLKTVYSSIALIFLIVGIALWKLNETYRAEKVAIKQNQLQTQLTALRSSLVSQISQLRNTLSAYTVQIDEAKINWVQLKPFYGLAVVQEDAANRLTINKLFLQSGSVAERWNSTTLQQNLKAKVIGNNLLRVQTFKDSAGLVHLALVVFDREKRNNTPRSGVMVIGDVSYFQRFFDLQRTSSITQVLLTNDKTVAAHSEYEYVGNLSDENKISAKNFFVDRQELRGTNLNLLSYSPKKAYTNFDIPLSMLGIILGLGFLMSGILLYVAKPESAQAGSAPAARVMKPLQAQSAATKSTAPQPLASQLSMASSSGVPPLEFDGEAQIVPIQIQACVQQAIFNIDRQLKSQGVTINKEFASGESISLDYPKFIKIFENVLLSLAQKLPPNKKHIQLRSYDDELLTVLEIQAPVQNFKLHDAITPELNAYNAEFLKLNSSAGEAILRFSFNRPEVSAPVVKNLSQVKTDFEKRFELNESAEDEFKLPAMTPVNSVKNDLDIDALLALDEDASADTTAAATGTKPELNIEKEMQPTKFKLDEKMSIVEDPEINIVTSEHSKADQTKVKIRRPEKG